MVIHVQKVLFGSMAKICFETKIKYFEEGFLNIKTTTTTTTATKTTATNSLVNYFN